MKRILLDGLLPCLLLLCALLRADSVKTNAPEPVKIPDVALREIASLGRLVSELAAERYAANSRRQETWVLTVHEGKRIRKYTDKKYTVLSLPMVEPLDRIALCGYATAYNSFNLEAADSMAKAGRSKEALELYQLVLRFDACGGLFKEEAQKKLAYLTKVAQGEDVETNLASLMALHLEFAPLMSLSDIETTAPTIVTNLLEKR